MMGVHKMGFKNLFGTKIVVAVAASLAFISACGTGTHNNLSQGSKLATGGGCTPPVVEYAYASPSNVNVGQSTTIFYGLVGNATAAYLEFPDGHQVGIGTPGSNVVTPSNDSPKKKVTYFIVGIGTCDGIIVRIPVVVTVNKNPPACFPQLGGFSANPQVIQAGQSSLLSWTVFNNVDSFQIVADDGTPVGANGSGQFVVSPTHTTTYFLNAWCQGNFAQAQTTVYVNGIVIVPTELPVLPGNVGSNHVDSIVVNGGLTTPSTLVLNASYFWDGVTQNQPYAIVKGFAYDSNNNFLGSGQTRIYGFAQKSSNINFGAVAPHDVKTVDVCIIGNNGTGSMLACKRQAFNLN